MTYRVPGTQVALPRVVGRDLSKSSVMPLSGEEGEELTPTLASRRGVFGLLQPPTPVQSLFTEVIAQEA